MKAIPRLEELEPHRERFISSISIGEPDECWLWRGGTFESGYGYFHACGLMLRAHRVAFKLFKGKDPGQLLVRHSCDTPLCCNPIHLLLGDWQDNMDDKVARGRESHETGMRKLNINQVREVRRLRASGMTMLQISKVTLITEASVGNLLRGVTYRTWK